jgi:hypothetical protein
VKNRREDACALRKLREIEKALPCISHEVLWTAMRLRIAFIVHCHCRYLGYVARLSPSKAKQPPRGSARRLVVQKALTSLQRFLYSFIDSPPLGAPA